MARLVFFFALFVAAAFCFLGAPATSTLRAVASTEAVESSTASEDLKETLKYLAGDLRTLADQLEALGEEVGIKVPELMDGDVSGRMNREVFRAMKQGLSAISNIIDGVKISIRNWRGNVKAVLLQALVDIDDVLSKMQRTINRSGILGSVVKTAFNALRRAVSTSLTAVSQVEYIKGSSALDILRTVESAVDNMRDVIEGLDNVL